MVVRLVGGTYAAEGQLVVLGRLSRRAETCQRGRGQRGRGQRGRGQREWGQREEGPKGEGQKNAWSD